MRRLENEDEEKFWEAWIKDDLIFCYRYGKIGSNGHLKLKKFKTRAEAEAELEQKLAEKLEEGFEEPGAEDEEEEEQEAAADDEAAEDEAADDDESADDEAADDDDESDDEEDDEKSAADDDDAEDDDAEDDGKSDEDDESDDEEDDEKSDDDEADEADEDSADEDEDSADEDEDSADEDEAPAPKRARATAPLVVAAPPPKPTLPARFRVRTPSQHDVAAAVTALDALRAGVGGRSWKVARLARRARHALEALGGADILEHESVSKALDAVMATVIAPKKRLSLEDALTLLWAVDAATCARTVARWRAKMLDSPASAAIGVLSSAFEMIPDPEVALHVGVALVNRRLSTDGFRHWFSRVRPFLESALASKGTSGAAFLGAVKPGSDGVIQARIAEARS